MICLKIQTVKLKKIQGLLKINVFRGKENQFWQNIIYLNSGPEPLRVEMSAKNYPWKFEGCDAQLCFHCSTTTKFTTSCRTTGVGYRITCILCEGSGALDEYQGESGRNMFTRGKEHLCEFYGGVSSNCMVIHSSKH